MRKILTIAVAVLLSVLLVACNSPANTQTNATETQVPVSTDTPEPAATPEESRIANRFRELNEAFKDIDDDLHVTELEVGDERYLIVLLEEDELDDLDDKMFAKIEKYFNDNDYTQLILNFLDDDGQLSSAATLNDKLEQPRFLVDADDLLEELGIDTDDDADREDDDDRDDDKDDVDDDRDDADEKDDIDGRDDHQDDDDADDTRTAPVDTDDDDDDRDDLDADDADDWDDHAYDNNSNNSPAYQDDDADDWDDDDDDDYDDWDDDDDDDDDDDRDD